MHAQRFRFLGWLMTALLVSPRASQAQTTAVGPYYATPSWDQTLASNVRFVVLANFNNEAVLDRETGLVWQRAAGSIAFTWFAAQSACINLPAGPRMGFRLPTIQELFSLVDTGASGPPFLPTNPFLNVQWSADGGSGNYWSATSLQKYWRGNRPDCDNGACAWVMNFGTAGYGPVNKDQTNGGLVWCVRGGANGTDFQ